MKRPRAGEGNDVADLATERLAVFEADAQVDSLTGLPNRSFVNERLDELVRSPGCRQAAVLSIDIDRFALVNDGLGHAAGDALLVVVAERLRSNLAPGDTVGRVGPDEFVVLLERPSADAVVRVASHLCDAVRRPVGLPSMRMIPTVSIGIAITAQSPPHSLLGDAHLAMRQARAAGGDCLELFHSSLRVAALAEIAVRGTDEDEH